MAAAPRAWAAELLHVWFHRLRPGEWFGGGGAVDELLQCRFGPDWQRLRARPAGEFLTDPRTALAAVLLFDQVPRNLFRGSGRAFATDLAARAITCGMLARGWDQRLAPAERHFLYMPLMHSEEIADQRLSIALFADLPRQRGLRFARDHYRMIARFGRFPHRNAELGRRSTAAEKRAIAAGFSW